MSVKAKEPLNNAELEDASDAEIASAIAGWRNDDSQGYDAAIALLCDIEELLSRRQA